MIRHYLAVAIRNAGKNRVFSAINLAGLSIGLACCILILLHVRDELSFDRYHTRADRIYRVIEFIESNDVGERSASMPFPTAEALKTDFPDLVEGYVRLFNFQAPTLSMEFREQEKAFNERRVFFADSTLWKVFDFELKQGDTQTALEKPNSVLLTESMAHKYFGEADPVGKVLRFQGEYDLMVTGVLADSRPDSHFQYDFLVSFSTLRQIYGSQDWLPFENWYWNPCWTYILLPENVQPEQLTEQFPEFVDKYFHPAIKEFVRMKLQPLASIHLASHLDYEIEPNSNEKNIYILSGIALFILLIACMNFMNLATARAIGRAREVGMRKTLGGKKSQLITQFLLESTLFAMVAVVLAFVLVELLIPFFNQIAGKSISTLFWLDPFVLGISLLAALVVGIGAGIYPAFVLTSFDPVAVLKGTHTQVRGLNLRKMLVVAQFAISIILIVGTGVSLKQLNFLIEDDPGFQREHVLMMPVLQSSMAQQYETFKDRAMTHSGVESVTALEEILGSKYQSANYLFEGMDESKLIPRLNMRHDFLKTFNIPLVAGRTYAESIETDDSLALVVNESLVRHMGWESNEAAVGKSFWNGHNGRQIVGVVKDFNFASKHHPISPLVIDMNTDEEAFNLFIKYMAIRIRPEGVSATIDFLSETWTSMIPDKPFEYFFLDEELQQLYETEQKLTRVSTAFSILAIIVACLGLFGLATYTAEQRRKEIGIRKVLGSSVSQVVLLLSADFTKLILIACVLAIPVAWLLMSRWLEGFAYRIDMGAGVFILAAVLALLTAWLTISFQAIRAARANPVDSLRNE